MSDVPCFIHRVPDGWSILPLRLIGQIANGATPSSGEPSYWDGEVIWVTPDDLGKLVERDLTTSGRKLTQAGYLSCGTTLVPANSIILSTRAPIGHLAIARVEACVNQGCRSITLTSDHVPEFFFYQLYAAKADLASLGTGSTFRELSREKLAGLKLLVPPPETQRAIADFLDRETAKIDALIAKQEELIERIKEKQQSAVSQAVSSGETRRVKNAAVFITSGPRGWSDFVADEGECFVQSGDLNNDLALVLETAKRVQPPVGAETARAMLSNDDVVVCITGANTGRVAHARKLVDRSYINQHLAIIRPKRNVAIGRYVAYSLYSARGRSYFDECQYGLKEGLNLSDVANAPLLLPDIAEQRRIVSVLDAQHERFTALKSKAVEAANLLREHRSALIAAAVTGQIDVASASAPPSHVATNDNRQALRVVVGAEIVSRQGAAKNFGRVKLQKLLYLAEVHAGIHELAGHYVREAAGPLAPDLLSETERGMEAAGFYRTVPPVNEGDGYTYSRIAKTGSHGDQFVALLDDRAAALTQLIDRFKDYDTRQVEAITTLYAVWNDALLDGETPSDDRIIRGVLEEWHPEKKDKFTVADLKTWLAWMRRNGVVPTGTGSRTQLDRLFV